MCTGQCQMVGSGMNLTRACPDRSDQSCQISCQDPVQSNVCVTLRALLVDGSPCGMCDISLFQCIRQLVVSQLRVPTRVVSTIKDADSFSDSRSDIMLHFLNRLWWTLPTRQVPVRWCLGDHPGMWSSVTCLSRLWLSRPACQVLTPRFITL